MAIHINWLSVKYHLRKSQGHYLFSGTISLHILGREWVNVSYIISDIHCYNYSANPNQ